MTNSTDRKEVLSKQQALLVSDPSAPGVARQLLADWLDDRLRLEDALLATSELVTNAVRYGGAGEGMLELTVHKRSMGYRVEVKQLTLKTVEAAKRFPEATKIRGRGLGVVQAVTDRWGVRHDDGVSTTVWFEIDHR